MEPSDQNLKSRPISLDDKTRDRDNSTTRTVSDGGETLLAEGDIVDGRFKVISTIGQGGMGAVYRVEQVYLQKVCALKVLAADKFSETAVRRFQQEAQAIAKLNHENLVKAHDFGMIDQHRAFFTMDLVEGSSLAQRLKRSGKLTVNEVLTLFIPLAFALDYAHNQGIVHRDIKPGNILLEEKNEADVPKLVDFGIAKLQYADDEGQALTRTGEIFGTPLYMSPEQCLGQRVDHRSDVYSLGCVMFESLTGTPPFVGENALSTMLQHQTQNPPTLKEASLGGEFPEALEAVIARCLEKDTEKRYQSMLDLANALIAVKEGKTMVPPAAPQLLPPSDSRKLTLIAVAAVLGTAIGGAFLFQYFQQTPPVSEESKRSLVTIVPPPHSAGEKDGSTKVRDKDREANRSGDVTVFLTKAGHSEPVIDVNHTEISDEDLLILKNDRRLIALNLDYTKITDRGMKTISRLDTLKHLYVDNTLITNKGISYLPALKKLKTLHISENKLDDGCLPYLAQLQNLEDLNIREAQITDAGLRQLRGLKKIARLQVNATQITDEGIREIVEMFPRLTILHARYQPNITNKSLKYLDKAKNLRYLTLQGCNIDPKAMKHFHATHPQVQEALSSAEKMFLKFTDPSK